MVHCVRSLCGGWGWRPAVVLGLALLVGCGENVQFNNPLNTQSPQAQTATSAPAKPEATKSPQANREAQARTAMIRSASIRSSGGGSSNFKRSTASAGSRASVAENVQKLRREIESSVEFSSTLLVWMIDATQSAAEIRADWAESAGQLYNDFQTNGIGGSQSKDGLATAVVAFGEKPTFVLEQPSTDLAAVVEKFAEIPSDNSGKETTFATVQQVLDKYGPLSSQQNRELLVVIVSDEAGDDLAQVDAAVQKAQSLGARIHAIGLPAPLGRARAEGSPQEPRTDGMPPAVQGPETRYSQHIDMKFGDGGFGGEDVDSGYGPFGLSYLTRSTGGAFLISRLRSARWPGSAMQFDDEVMRKYPPQYLSEQEYQAKLQENKALAALHLAARQQQVEAMAYPSSQFQVGDEARLKNALDRAQRLAARLEPLVNSIYDPLNEGARDRDKISDPRWQASFDLAMGRAAAAKARVDGYNQMLAILKGGRAFEDPSHDTWILEPADTLEEAGSRLEKMRLDAKQYLQRVIDEHPGTPWAYFAERELESPIGWKWTES